MLFVIKIGGSCITYKKEKIPKIRYKFLSLFAHEIKKIKKLESEIKIIIVHGGGSITHPLVDLYNLGNKLKNKKITKKDDKISVAKLHVAMNSLNNVIVNFFLKEGIEVWPMQTSAISFIKKNEIPYIDMSSIQCALDNNIIPILHGDVILDELYYSNIFSGDQIASVVAEEMKSDWLIFFTNVDGVYEWYDSEDFHGKVIKHLSLDKKNIQFNSKEIDYSGDMKGKIEYIQEHCKNVENIIICNGLISNNIKKIFNKNIEIGTVVNI